MNEKVFISQLRTKIQNENYSVGLGVILTRNDFREPIK